MLIPDFQTFLLQFFVVAASNNSGLDQLLRDSKQPHSTGYSGDCVDICVMSLHYLVELIVLRLRNRRDLNEDAEEVGLEYAPCRAVIGNLALAQVLNVILANPFRPCVKIVAPVKVVRLGRVGSDVQDNVKRIERKAGQCLFLSTSDCRRSLFGGLRRGRGFRWVGRWGRPILPWLAGFAKHAAV